MESLRTLGRRWKQYEKEGKWKYQGEWKGKAGNQSDALPAHPFWCTGYTFVSPAQCVYAWLTSFVQWGLHSEAPDLFQYLSDSNLVIFKGDLNHRKLTYDCHAPLNTPFSMAIGPLASEPGAPPICSLRTIKSDVVVGIPPGVGEKLDEEEPGWKISGKYVSGTAASTAFADIL